MYFTACVYVIGFQKIFFGLSKQFGIRREDNKRVNHTEAYNKQYLGGGMELSHICRICWQEVDFRWVLFHVKNT